MSVIRKIPYIESVIGALSEEELATLQTIINTGSAGTPASISNLPSGIAAVHFTMPSGRVKDGILVKKSCLIGYDGTQRITAYKIADGLISESYEYCDINELRRIVFDVGNAGGFVNPMTNAGDLIVGGTDGEATRLGIGATKEVLTSNGTTASWQPVIPTVTIEVTQIVGQNPLEIQLTNDQYDIFRNNNQVLVDLAALGENSVVWSYVEDDVGSFSFGFFEASLADYFHRIAINKTSKVATYISNYKQVYVENVRSSIGGDDAGKLLAIDVTGFGTLTNNLPILTTAPSSANTEGGIIIVVLTSEPATKYDGYLYIIKEV